MDNKLAAIIACSFAFGTAAEASPISEARLQELMSSRDRQEVRLETLRSRDKEILTELGQVLWAKYGPLLEGSEMVFTRAVENGTVYHRMDFVGLKGRDRARALCEILNVDKCIALGTMGQMTLLQADGHITVSATGIIEDGRPFGVNGPVPQQSFNPKAREIESNVRKMLDPLQALPVARPASAAEGDDASTSVELPAKDAAGEETPAKDVTEPAKDDVRDERPAGDLENVEYLEPQVEPEAESTPATEDQDASPQASPIAPLTSELTMEPQSDPRRLDANDPDMRGATTEPAPAYRTKPQILLDEASLDGQDPRVIVDTETEGADPTYMPPEAEQVGPPTIDPSQDGVGEGTMYPVPMDEYAPPISPDRQPSMKKQLEGALTGQHVDIAAVMDAFVAASLGAGPDTSGLAGRGTGVDLHLPGIGRVDMKKIAPSLPAFGAAAEVETEAQDQAVLPAQDKRQQPKIVLDEVTTAQIEIAPDAATDALDMVEAEQIAILELPLPRGEVLARMEAKGRVLAPVSMPIARSQAMVEVSRRTAEAAPFVPAADMPGAPMPRATVLAAFEADEIAAATRLALVEREADALEINEQSGVSGPKPRPEVAQVEVAEAAVSAEDVMTTVPAEAEEAPRTAMSSMINLPGIKISVPIEGIALGTGARVGQSKDHADPVRMSSNPKVEIELLGTVAFNDQFAVPASIDFANGRDAGRLQKLPHARPDLSPDRMAGKPEVQQMGVDMARIALDVSRGLRPAATVAQVPGMGQTSGSSIAPPGFFEGGDEAMEPSAPASPTLQLRERLLEKFTPAETPEDAFERAILEGSPPLAEEAVEDMPRATAGDAEKPKLPSLNVPAPIAFVDAEDADIEAAGLEQDETELRAEQQRQALDILKEIAKAADAKPVVPAAPAPAPVPAAPTQAEVAPPASPAPTMPSRQEAIAAPQPTTAPALAPLPSQSKPSQAPIDFDEADLRIELSYVNSRDAVRERATELRAFFPPVMLEKGRFFGASVPGHPSRFVVGLEAIDLSARDDLVWYMDQIGMPWAIRD